MCEWLKLSSSRVSSTITFHSSFITCDVTYPGLTAVANISQVGHLHMFSSFFPDHKSHLHVAFWSLALRASPEEHRWVDFPRVFWSHVIILEAQTAPWVAFFDFTEEDSCPVAAQQTATARECVNWNSCPVLFGQLKSGCCSIDVLSEILFSFSVFVIIRGIWVIWVVLVKIKCVRD